MTIATSPRSHDDVWRAALGELELSVTQPTFETWLKPTCALGLEGDVLLVGTPSAYGKDWLENKLAAEIRRALSRVTLRPMDFEVQVQSRANGRHGAVPPTAPARPAESSNGHHPKVVQTTMTLERPELNPAYTFATYVVGSANKLAYAAANAVAESPGHRFNPLFLYGGVGLGKTHLLQAVGHLLAGRGYRVRYVTTETFTNDLISAIRTQTTEEFRNRYRQVDALLLDDVQFLVGKESTQEEVFHTFNAMHSANRQIIISSDRPPRSLVTLEARLRSRFEGGLIADIQPPDVEMRVAILRSHAETQPIAVPGSVLELLAQRIQSNIRELVGALVQVVGYAQLLHAPLDAQIVDRVLASSAVRRPMPSRDLILHTVADFYRISVEDLTGAKRVQRIVVPRHVAMYLMREDGQMSLPQIGQTLKRDHTTALHGIERIAAQFETDEALRREITAIRERLYRASQ
ncbi:MAG: chromosomal replication initiator protein DnaA [Anaerolineae bacterium]|nr:chromosomal replication initiator protein DnaA [Anaerolineae bacterium]